MDLTVSGRSWNGRGQWKEEYDEAIFVLIGGMLTCYVNCETSLQGKVNYKEAGNTSKKYELLCQALSHLIDSFFCRTFVFVDQLSLPLRRRLLKMYRLDL